ncbi:MAG: putative glycoside hydrolase, partial [Acidimicrobiia bacterium]
EQAAGLTVDIAVAQRDRLDAATLTFDGRRVDAATRVEGGFRWAAGGPLPAGRHELVLTVPRPVLPSGTFRWTFEVDATPPTLDAPALVASAGMDDRVRIDGKVEAGASLTADGEPVELGEDGSFTLRYDRPPAGSVLLRAEDDAGHVVYHEVFTPVARPNVRGVHVSASGWASTELRTEVLRLVEERRIDTIQLDIKDEDGVVGYRSGVPLAKQIGATRNLYDLRAVVDQLHGLGIRVVGRVVAFRDPILADWAWDGDRRDLVLQRPGGVRHEAYGGFTNFANHEVQAYNTAIALEAARAGVDEILWDYVRRPEGDVTQLVVPGLEGTAGDGLVEFLAESHRQLRRLGVFQGASVFGVAAKEPESVGQDVGRMARHVDYLSPMVYPSLWKPGEYRVSDPARRPYDIVVRSLADFQAKSNGTGIQLTPWLQDFSLDGVTYGEAQVRAQIDAAASLGITGFLLWNPRVRYHGESLDPA